MLPALIAKCEKGSLNHVVIDNRNTAERMYEGESKLIHKNKNIYQNWKQMLLVEIASLPLNTLVYCFS